jgi:hypothetical protein
MAPEKHPVHEGHIRIPPVGLDAGVAKRLNTTNLVSVLEPEQGLERRADAGMSDDEQHLRPRDAADSALPCNGRIRFPRTRGVGTGRERAGVTACPTSPGA